MKTFVVLASCLTVASAGFAVAQFGGAEQLGRANTNTGFLGANENVRSITNSVPSLPLDLFSTSSSDFKMFGVRDGGGKSGFNNFASIGGNGFDREIRHGGGAGGSGFNGYENVVKQGGSSGTNVGGHSNVIRHGGGAGGNGGGYESGIRHGSDAGSDGAGGYANGGGQGSGTGANGSNNVGGSGSGNVGDAGNGGGGEQGGIRRFVSVHVAPDDNTPVEPRVIRAGGLPETHFNIIFVKAPSTPVQQTEVVLPPNPKQKTLVYVLVKRDENQDNVKIKTPEPTKPSKPEVYFIRYKSEPEDSAGGAGPESGTNSNGNISEGHGESNGFGPGAGDALSGGSPSVSYGAPPPQHGGEPARYQ